MLVTYHCHMELEVARGVQAGTASSDRSPEDPGLASMVKRAFPGIGTHEVSNLHQQLLQTFSKVL